MEKEKTGVLLVNLGTPDSPKVSDVRKYLKEFLMDERVIDIPFINRWIMVNLIIANFRSPKSAKEYEKLWDERGSPLKYFGFDLRELLQKSLGENFEVEFGMRYQNPSLKSALESLRAKNVSKIIVIPLFPQYASASTGSVSQKVNEIVNKWQIIPSIAHINHFLDHPKFIEAFTARGNELLQRQSYDHFIFSYHGLPERQILKGAVDNLCQFGTCCNSLTNKNKYCYRAQCFFTSRLLAKAFGLNEGQYTTTFQSRLGKTPWIKPYTDEVLTTLPANGIKKVIAFSPSFVADCLETTIEVGQEFKESFIEAGGEVWDLVPSLNDSDIWVDCLQDLVRKA